MTQPEQEAYNRGFQEARGFVRQTAQLEVEELTIRNRSMRGAMVFAYLVAAALSIALVALWVTR